MNKPGPDNGRLIFGGTFDPVHAGHLRMALELRDRFGAMVHLVPSGQPVHRQAPQATATQRLQMLRLGIGDEPGLIADDREIRRSGPSWSVLTLEEIRQEIGQTASLSLVIGADAFNQFTTWYRWQDILRLANLVVISRPGWQWTMPNEMAKETGERTVCGEEAIGETPAGAILYLTMTALAISSSEIRQLIRGGQSARYLLPEPVWEYIRSSGIYSDLSGAPGA